MKRKLFQWPCLFSQIIRKNYKKLLKPSADSCTIMSEKDKKPVSPVSNEEVIDDLTKDLESSLVTEADPGKFVINPGSSSENMPWSSGDSSQQCKLGFDTD